MSTIKHSPHNSKIVIEVEEDGQASLRLRNTPPPPVNLGLLPSNSPVNLRRLRKKKKQKPGIRFYDLGVTENLNISTEWIPNILTGGENFDLVDLPILEFERMLNEIYFQIFTHPIAELKDKARLIDKQEVFSRGVKIRYATSSETVTELLKNSDKFQDSTLTLTQEEVASLVVGGDGVLFYSSLVDLTNLYGVKVTKIRDFNAPSVDFTPSNQFDLFLLPSIIKQSGETAYYNGIHEETNPETGARVLDVILYKEILNYNFSTFPREFYNAVVEIDPEGGYYQATYKLWEVLKQLPNARASRIIKDFYNTPPYNYYYSNSVINPAAFPNGAFYTPTYYLDAYPYKALGFFANIEAIERQGMLIFFIIQKNETYYFWRD